MRQNNRKNLIILVIVLILIIGIGIGTFMFLNNKKYEYKLETIETSQIQYYKLEQNGKYGIIDKDGNLLIEPKYNSIDIPNPTKAIFIASEDGEKFKAIDNNEQEILTQFESVEAININNITSNIPYEKTVLKYKQNGLYGLIDFEGNKITENIYNSIVNIDYKEGCLRVEQNGKYGIININGTQLINPEYDSIMADGYYDEETKYKEAGFILRIKTDDGYRFGYADQKGKMILEPSYNEINRITEITSKDTYIITASNGKYGLMKNGKEVLKNEYTELDFDKNNNLLIVQKDTAQGVLDIDGNNIIPIDYDSIIIGGEYINAQKGEETIIFDSKGNNLNTDIISYNKVNEKYAIVIDKNNNYNIVDNSGNKKLRESYIYIEYYNDNKFIVTKDGKTAIIDENGNTVIDKNYNAIQKIDDTNTLQAIDTSTNRTDIIDSNMNIHIGLENSYISKKENYIKLYSENDVKYFDLEGNETTYKDLFPNNKIYADKKNGKWGLIDGNGNIIANYEYDMVTEQNGNVAGVKKDGKWQVVDIEGQKIFEDQYTITWLDVTFLGNYYQINNSKSGTIYSGTIQNS